MIKAIIFLTKLILATLVAMLFSSCKHTINLGDGIDGNGNVITQTRVIDKEFTGIDVSHGIDLAVELSQEKSIIVEADENLQKHIVVRVENNILIVEADENYNSTNTPQVTVKMPVIKELYAEGGSSLRSNNDLICENLKVKSSSGSEIEIAVQADNLSLESSSGSNIAISGMALKLETITSSGSEIDARKLMANDVTAQSTSGSSTSVFPILSLNAKASSGSSIDYHKNPKIIKKEESSGGSVSEQ